MDAPARIPLKGGDEQDVFSQYARSVHCYTQRSGVCQAIKRKYNRRLRRIVRLVLRRPEEE
jgi:hypothetical protein